MKQDKTARELLAQIEKDFFNGAGLAEASLLEGSDRRAFVLSQVERLLTTEQGATPLALLLSDVFWTADEGRVQRDGSASLLMSPAGQRTLTDEEMSRLRLILSVAGLCHDLGLHFKFDLKEAFGVKNDFWVSNKQLVEWLNTTAYERIAMHTAYIMKKFAISTFAAMFYQPAQDALAELYSTEYRELVSDPDSTEMPPREYVKFIVDALLQIERHWRRGRRLKLRPDLVMLHDEICGVMPLRFDKGVLRAAQALYDYMDHELCGRLVLEEYNLHATSWSDQPESVRRTRADVLERFAEKVREVRSEYLGAGWVSDDSLSFGYLMAHAQRCGIGLWREENDAL